MTKLAGASSGDPRSTRTTDDGATASATPVPASIAAVIVSSVFTSLRCPHLRGLLDLVLHGLEVEARALLHRRELDRRLGQLPDLLLDVDEPPELVDEPGVVVQRTGHSRALEGVEAEVHEDRHVRLH